MQKKKRITRRNVFFRAGVGVGGLHCILRDESVCIYALSSVGYIVILSLNYADTFHNYAPGLRECYFIYCASLTWTNLPWSLAISQSGHNKS